MPFSAAEISRHFTPKVIGRDLEFLEELTSTNDAAMAAGKAGFPEGRVIFAETQTAGRGRLGRRWISPPGCGLWFSVLLRPTFSNYSILSLAAGVAVARSVEQFCDQPAHIKWPNDIYLSEKKLGGILCEASSGFVVVGIGLNVNQGESDFDPEITARATSLALQTGASVDRAKLAAHLLTVFDEIYFQLPDALPLVIAECEKRSFLTGRKVRVESAGEMITGTVSGLDSTGGLCLQTASGPRVLISGEVTLFEVADRLSET